MKNRWAWLAINLVTAFLASRVIGAFEDSIEKLVALAALMPIVAGIGGNSGNKTITMIVRAIPMRQKFGADPAIGGSVMITALTDSGGFFIFLGLATLFLM